jgi:hypothetical protein
MVEIFFGILTRQALKGASFSSKEDLINTLETYVDAHNEDAKPYKWRKREVNGSQLKNTIKNLFD